MLLTTHDEWRGGTLHSVGITPKNIEYLQLFTLFQHPFPLGVFQVVLGQFSAKRVGVGGAEAQMEVTPEAFGIFKLARHAADFQGVGFHETT